MKVSFLAPQTIKSSPHGPLLYLLFISSGWLSVYDEGIVKAARMEEVSCQSCGVVSGQ
jgi:hypothetical protein